MAERVSTRHARTYPGGGSLGLHGLGRVGRAVFRLTARERPGAVGAVNDLNDDHENLRYLLRFDSVYGRSELELEPCELGWRLGGSTVAINHFTAIDEVPWSAAGADVVIDCSGAEATRAQYEQVLATGVRAVVVTRLTEHADLTMVPGVNECDYDPAGHQIISAGTCDGMALAPVLARLQRDFGIDAGSVTTLHPALSYQNVLDGAISSTALPKQYLESYGLGRAAGSNVLPKPTSALHAVEAVVPGLADRMQAMSFRVPTQAVSMAAVWLRLSRPIRPGVLDSALSDLASAGTVELSADELVSSDLIGIERSAVVDERFSSIDREGRHVRLMLWYDNEWGYAAHLLRVVDVLAGGRPPAGQPG